MTTLSIFLAALFVSGAVAAPGPDDPGPLMLIPQELDLGSASPGARAEALVWLVNTGDRPVKLLRAKGSCGCIGLDVPPQTIAAGSGLRVAFSVKAPRHAGHSKTVFVTFAADAGAPLKLPVRIAAAGARPKPSGVVADPNVTDLGPVIAGSSIQASVRLINTGDVERRVKSARASCGCITFPGFAPLALAPGGAADIHIEVDIPETIGPNATKVITLVVEGQSPVKVPLRMVVEHPRADVMKQHLDALLVDLYTYGEFRVDGDAVTAIAWESGRAEPTGRVTCRFTETGTVHSTLFESFAAAGLWVLAGE